MLADAHISSLGYLWSLLLENLVLGNKFNQQTKKMRTKTNYKPKANDKGKDNNAIFFSKPGRVQYKKNELKYRRAVHRMYHSKFQSDNKNQSRWRIIIFERSHHICFFFLPTTYVF